MVGLGRCDVTGLWEGRQAGGQGVIVMVGPCYPKQDPRRLEVRNPSGFLAEWSRAVTVTS